MSKELKQLIGKVVTGESKAPRRDIREFTTEVSHVLSLPTRAGDQVYTFGVDKNGNVGLQNTAYWYADSLVATDSVDFKAQSLEDWFVIPSDEGVVDNHFAWCEKVSKKAQKRLPANAIKLADCVL